MSKMIQSVVIYFRDHPFIRTVVIALLLALICLGSIKVGGVIGRMIYYVFG